MAPVVLHHWSVALLPDQHAAVPLVAGRSIHAYWLFLSPHFRTVLLPPQRRVAEATAAWSWHHHGPLTPPNPPELTQLRASLREALRSLKDAADTPLRSAEPDHLQRQAILLELSVRMHEVVERLLQLSDANLSGFVCRTDDGLRVHSWGAHRADRPRSPEAVGPAPEETRRRRSATWFTGRKTVLALLVLAAGITSAWWWMRDDSGAAPPPRSAAGIEERAQPRPGASLRSHTEETRAAAAGPAVGAGSLEGAAPARTTAPVGLRADAADPGFAPTEAFASRESAPTVARAAGGLAPVAAGGGGPGAGGAPIHAARGGGTGGGAAPTAPGAPAAGARGGRAGGASASTAPVGGAASSDGDGGPGGAASAVRAPAPPDAVPSQRSPAERPTDEPSPAERDAQDLEEEDPAAPDRDVSPEETRDELPSAPDRDGNVAGPAPPANLAGSATPSRSPSTPPTTPPTPASPPAPAAAAAAPTEAAVATAEQQGESASLATDPSSPSATAANPPLQQTLSLAVPQWRLVPLRHRILPTLPQPAEAPDQVESLRRATLEQWRDELPNPVRELRPRLGFTLRFPELAATPAIPVAWASRSGTAPPPFRWDATPGVAEIGWADRPAAAGEAELRDDDGRWLARVRWEPDGRLTLSTWRTTTLEAWVEVPAAAATVLPRLQAFLLPKEGGTPIRASNPAATPSNRYRWPVWTWSVGAACLLTDDTGSWALHTSLDAQLDQLPFPP